MTEPSYVSASASMFSFVAEKIVTTPPVVWRCYNVWELVMPCVSAVLRFYGGREGGVTAC